METDYMLVFYDSEGYKDAITGFGSNFVRRDGTFRSHYRRLIKKELDAGCAYVFGREYHVRNVFNK